MITASNNRLDPSQVAPDELEGLASAFARPGHVALVDDEGLRTEIPEPLFRYLARIMRLMAEGKAIVMLPEDEAFTTQAAANYIGCSRKHLVGLLEGGEIPFHKVGTHRRVVFSDLLEYEKKRDSERRGRLRSLAGEVDAEGLYDSSFTGETR